MKPTHISLPQAPGFPRSWRKPLKRFLHFRHANTRLKPGANEKGAELEANGCGISELVSARSAGVSPAHDVRERQGDERSVALSARPERAGRPRSGTNSFAA